MWPGLVIAAINSVVICVIGANTAQYGFIVANVFCIFAYLLNVRSWMRDRKTVREYREYMNSAAFMEASGGDNRFQPNMKHFARASAKGNGLFLAYNARAISSAAHKSPSQQPAAENSVLAETGH